MLCSGLWQLEHERFDPLDHRFFDGFFFAGMIFSGDEDKGRAGRLSMKNQEIARRTIVSTSVAISSGVRLMSSFV